MRIRGTIGAILALAAIAASPAQAQNPGAGMADRQQAMIDTVVVQLELSEEQEQAFRAIMAEQLEGMRAILEEYQGARNPQMREDMMAVREETDEKLGIILSEEQIVHYQKIRDELREQFRGSRQTPPQD